MGEVNEMTLRGNAFMAIWHDVRPEAEHEYSLWHTREHMPERVGVPGFERGRRYVCLEPREIPVLHSLRGHDSRRLPIERYREHLNAPTLWTSRLQRTTSISSVPRVRRLQASGPESGERSPTIRLNFESGGAEDFRRGAGTLAEQILKLDGVSGAHVGNAEPGRHARANQGD